MAEKSQKRKMSNKKFLAVWIPALCVVLALAVGGVLAWRSVFVRRPQRPPKALQNKVAIILPIGRR